MSKVRTVKRGKTWQYIFECAKVDGKRKRCSACGFKTKKEAEAAGNRAYAEYNEAGILFTPSEQSFSDYLDYWVANFGESNWKPETIHNYKKRIRLYIKPTLGIYKMSALTAQCLQEFITTTALTGISRNTLSSIKGILSGSLNFAVKQNIIKFNPMYSVKLPMKRNEKIKSRSKPHVYIPPEKIDMIFERFNEGSSDYIPLLLGYRCGLRLGEAFGLTWDCIDFEKKTLTVNKQVQWDEKMQCWYFTAPKYDSFRTIEIDDELVAIFARLRDKQLKAKTYYAELYTELYEGNKRAINAKEGTLIELVCIRENGTYIQPRTMQHTASIIHHKMNYPEFTFHSLRHTHATILAENDVPPKYVQERLGHKDIYTTLKFYQHLTKKISEKGTGIMSKIFATT